MPGKGTDINLRRLYTSISQAEGMGSQGVMKVFDSVEWEFLWQVLDRFNFGPKFVSWIQLSYRHPSARVRTKGTLSLLSPSP